MAQKNVAPIEMNIDAMLYGTGTDDYSGLSMRAYTSGEAAKYVVGDPIFSILETPLEKYEVAKKNRKIIEQTKQTYNKNNRFKELRRLAEFAKVIFVSLLIAASLGVVLYNEAVISNQNYLNNKKEDSIETTRRETKMLRESLSQGADLEWVREEAKARLGMVEPNDQQVVAVIMPGSDRLMTSISYNSLGITDEMVSEAKRDLARYYSTK
ncbi:MAG TPA: hypothetical protein PKV44_02700 [Bacillota bacterium]|nr:hypothetical protein [Bacillota bacterium]HPE38204.1 hypothetical protein [Bacillota bacterium]